MELGYLLRYFAHGIIWSALMTLVSFLWVFILAAMVLVGWLLGLVLGFVLLFFMMGNVNSAIMRWVWDIDIELDWKGNVIHGLVLFIALFIVSILTGSNTLLLIVMYTVNPKVLSDQIMVLVLIVISFVISCPIDGFVAKKVAMVWEEERHTSIKEEHPDVFAGTQE